MHPFEIFLHLADCRRQTDCKKDVTFWTLPSVREATDYESTKKENCLLSNIRTNKKRKL